MFLLVEKPLQMDEQLGGRASSQRRHYLLPHGLENVSGGSPVVRRHTDASAAFRQHDPELPVDAVHAPRLVATAQPHAVSYTHLDVYKRQPSA